MKKKNVALIGASGRMGQEIAILLKSSRNLFPAIGMVSSGEAPQFLKTVKKLQGKDFADIDVIVDFSSADLFCEVLQFAQSQGISLVSGVTGISTEDKKAMSKAAKKIPILWAPNMSLGVAALTSALQSLQPLSHFDFQVEEMHHSRKKDRPSGTALYLQQTLEKSVGKRCPAPVAIRGGGIFGVHKVYAMSENEVLVFEHVALNRRLFAEGAVMAAQWIFGKPPRLYQMKDVLLK